MTIAARLLQRGDELLRGVAGHERPLVAVRLRERGRSWPACGCAAATVCPWRAKLRARLLPMTARPVTPIWALADVFTLAVSPSLPWGHRRQDNKWQLIVARGGGAEPSGNALQMAGCHLLPQGLCLKESRPMVHTTMRSVAVLGSVGLVAVALAACSSSSGGSSSGGDTNSGAGKTLNVYIGDNTQYPAQQKPWFDSTSRRSSRPRPAPRSRSRRSPRANDELTKIQTSVLSGQGPDIYSPRHHVHPDRVRDRRVRRAQRRGLDEDRRARTSSCRRRSASPVRTTSHQVGIPFASRPFVMAYNKDLLTAAGIDKPATTWDGLRRAGQEAHHRRQLRPGDRLRRRLRPVEVHLGDVDPGRQPARRRQEAQLDDPTAKTAYQTYLGWLTKDKVVDPAAIGWKNAQAIAAFAPARRRSCRWCRPPRR